MRLTAGVLLFGLAALGGGVASKDEAAGADDKGKGAVVDFDGLQSRAPADWKEEEAKGPLRFMVFRLPKAKGDERDAEVVIFKGIGGGAKANLERWKGQFKPPAGKKIEDVASVSEFKVGKADVFYLDVQGTFLDRFPPFDPNAKITERPDYRLLGIHFEGEKNPYHIKLTGPAKTVEQYKKGFDDWVKAFK